MIMVNNKEDRDTLGTDTSTVGEKRGNDAMQGWGGQTPP
jgi:hypothetical protein